jgi:hypothetical protein
VFESSVLAALLPIAAAVAPAVLIIGPQRLLAAMV